MKKLLLMLLPLAAIVAGCKYDDSDIWEEVNAQKAKIAALETSVSSMNSNITSLQSLISSLQDKVTVNGVTTTDNGYMIYFSDGTTAKITNGTNGKDGADGKDGNDGKDGVDGQTPQIGAKADTDGNYYWTVSGEWLLDASGNKVPTSKTPKVKIEDDQWMVSYDDGATWSKIEGQSASASCIFESVTTDASNAIFTLSDGSVITVPLTSAAVKLQLVFDESVFASMRNGELLSTAYKIIAAEGAEVDFETFESDGWTVTIRPSDERSGRISIQAPEKVAATKVLFLLTDDQGGSFVKIISIGVNDSEKPTVKTQYTVDYLGGELIIPVISSTATIGDNGEEWMEIVSTGDEVVLKLAENGTYDWRTARVTLEDGTVITITQTTKDALILDKTVINIDGKRQIVAIPVRTNISVTATVTEGSDWISATPSTRALTTKIFSFTAKRNTTETERTAKIEFSGKGLTETCTVIQAVFEGDPTVDVTEALAADEGEEVELKTALIVAGTTDGYVVADGGSYIFVEDASNAPQWAGDSVKISALSTRFNDMAALGSVTEYTTVSEKNQVALSYTDITSSVDDYSAATPQAVKVTGDFYVDSNGDYFLLASGAAKKVVIYKPASYTSINERLANHNIDLYGIYYGESDGAAVVIAVRLDDNGSTSGETTGYPYKKVTSVTSGKSYLIVALDGRKAYVAKPVTSNYGYLKVDTMTDDNGTINAESRLKDNEFVITSATDGYTILQSDGRYLYQTGTYTSFNVTASPSSGQYWSITPESDGTFTITNLSVNKWVQYSVSHTSYGSYASAQSGALMPCLYEYVGSEEESGGDDSSASYTITSKSGYPIGNTSSSSNDLKCAASGNYTNTISYDSTNGCVDIVSSETYLRYNSASNGLFFRYYKASSYSNQEPIQLYKLDGDSFIKVTSAQSDWSGEYLIVYEAGGLAFDGSQTNLRGVHESTCTISVSISNGAIAANSTNKASTFTISK